MELTREKVLAMEAGRGLDSLMAQRVTKFVSLTTAILPDGTTDHTPKYSTDITAAWEVVEKMRRPFSNRVRFAKEMQNQMNKKLIEDEADIRIAPTEIIFHMTPLNICRAALLTTLKED